jgi:transposase-like protein
MLITSGWRFLPELSQQAIKLYGRFTLCCRDFEDEPAEPGSVVSYGMLRRWANHFGRKIAGDIRTRWPNPSSA